MPIEIKELIIKATIEDSTDEPTPEKESFSDSKHKIISECVDEVLRILEERNQR